MDPILALAFGVVVPALVALALVVVLRRPFARTARGGETDLPAPWAAGFGLAAAYGIGVGLLLGWPDLPPVDVTLVAPWAAGVAAFLGLIRDGRVRGAASGVLGLGLGVFMTGPIEDMALRVGLIAGVTASMVALERGLARLSERLDPRGAALSQIVLVSGAALAVLFSDTASLAQATGGLAAGLGALFTLGLLWPRAAVLTRAAPAVAAILVTNLWGTTLFANGHPAFIPPLAASRRAILRIAVPAALIGIPIAAAGAFAGLRYFATEDASASEHATGPTDPTSPSAATPATPSGTPTTTGTPTTPGTSGYDPGYGY